MNNFILIIFIIEMFISLYVLIYILFFVILYLKNKQIIDDYFIINEYRIRDNNTNREILSNKDRMNYIYEIVNKDNRISNQNLFKKIIELYTFLKVVIGCFIIILLVAFGFTILHNNLYFS